MLESDAQLSESGVVLVGDYRVEPSTLRVIGNGQETLLEPRAMQLLVYFAVHQGRVLSRSELEEEVWGGRVVGEDALTNSISKLRRALGDNARNPVMIETVPKTGYRLIASVQRDVTVDSTESSAMNSPGKESPRQRSVTWWVIAALLAGIVFAGWWFYSIDDDTQTAQPTDSMVSDKPAVAIIPFDNLADEQQDYFANGITTNLITDMSKLSGITVIARGSVFSYQNTSAGTRQISRELNADYVVKGAVQRLQDQLRVNVQLIDAGTEQAVWAERYESKMSDLFKLQDQIASALVSAMRISIAPEERGIFSQYPTTNVTAYDLFLRGQEEYGYRTPEANRLAREYFEQAVALDPQFARATAGLALVYSREAIDGWTDTPGQSLEQATEYVDEAARINPTIPQIHFVSAQVALFNQQHDEAIRAIKRAIKFAPNYADAYALLAWILNYAGESKAALAELQTALRLNPITPSSYYQTRGEIRYVEGRYAEAVEAFRSTLLINPTHTRAHMWLIASLVQSGELEEARWQVSELLLNDQRVSLSRLNHAFPFRNDAIRQQLMENLKKAGLPE